MYRYFSLAVISFLVAASSVSATTYSRQTRKPIASVTLPKVGTMIVNTYYVTDSSGALVPKTKEDPHIPDDTIIVIRSNIRMFGRDRCVEFANLSANDTSIISYAPNGDIYSRRLGTDTIWTLVPFGMPPKKILRKKLPNDTSTFLLRHFNMPHSRTWEVLGTDTSSAAGKVYRCVKLQIVDIRTYQGKDWHQGMLYWFSPQLGYYVRMNFGWNGPYFLNQQIKIYQVASN